MKCIKKKYISLYSHFKMCILHQLAAYTKLCFNTGNMWSQSWNGILDILQPYKGKESVDVTQPMKDQVPARHSHSTYPHAPRTRTHIHIHATHMPLTRHVPARQAHAMHTPCTCYAHATHAHARTLMPRPRTHIHIPTHAHATHTPRKHHVHATHALTRALTCTHLPYC
jgi:hypothetical protein